MALDLVPIWTALLALAVFYYVVFDGFDLGVVEVQREAVRIHRHPLGALLDGEAVVERVDGGVRHLTALGVARARVVLRPVGKRPLIAVEVHDAETEGSAGPIRRCSGSEQVAAMRMEHHIGLEPDHEHPG